MTIASPPLVPTYASSPVAAHPRPRRRVGDWLGAAFAAVVWCPFVAGWLFDIQSFTFFLAMTATYLLMTLLFAGWWFTRRSFTVWQRLAVCAGAVLSGVGVGLLSARAINPPFYLVLFGLPIVLAVWALWVPMVARRSPRPRALPLIACIAAAWAVFLLVRVNGLQGDMRADVHWRWTPTAEEAFLAQRTAPAGPAAPSSATTLPTTRPLELRPGDWPGFRGPGRDGIVRGLSVDLDWQKSPPKVLWRQRVGPAWSSVAVADGYAFTQEQRAGREAVVCRDALTGREVWAHEGQARFEEPMSGPGPRATPTFAGGRIYAQGALGKLSCLDAATGGLIWSRDVRADSGAKLPIWGFCGSPLVTGGKVIVYAAGEAGKALLAYPLDGGPPLWTAGAGKVSYASPQVFAFGGEQQVLMFTSEGLFAVEPAGGVLRWQLPIPAGVGVPSVDQPCLVAPDALVLGNGGAFGTERVQVTADGRSAARGWVTRQMKPSFSDMVYHDGFVYGFDGTVFCCLDAATGARRWREGNYGAGQVVLLEQQGVMIVTTEGGQAVLLRCNPQRSEELGRVPAVTGKTWNHPAVAQDRLYVRSDGELACLQLQALVKP